MPLLDLQRRAVEIGRVRIGVKAPTSKGGLRPAKLGVFRFTSRDESAIVAVADMFGGEARRWDDAPTDDQWEVITTAKELPVSVPPGPQAVSQWYETWSGGGCQRRCDGVQEQLSGRPCLCGPDPKQRVCRPTTRVSIILPDIPGLGVWRLESKGWNAAHELGATAETLAAVRQAGVTLPAVLRLEQRQSVSGGQTKNFVVPVLVLRQTLREIGGIGEGTMMLPPAPTNVRAIEAAQVPADRGAGDGGGLPPWPPVCPQDLAVHVEACTDVRRLDEIARGAQKAGWMDEFVDSKYAPTDGEAIELVEVFRARRDHLSGGQS